MSVEMTLFKKEPLLPINSEEMVPLVKDISEKIIKDVFEKDETFDFYKRKVKRKKNGPKLETEEKRNKELWLDGEGPQTD